MASVTLDHWESTRGRPGRVTLPPTLSLSDFETKFFIRWCAKATANQSPRAQALSGKSLIPKDDYASAMDCAKTLQ